MTINQKAALLKMLQKQDWEMRLRHYPAVLEDTGEPERFAREVDRDRRYTERLSEEECYGDAERFFLEQQL